MMRAILVAGALLVAGASGAAAQGTCPAGIARDGVWLEFPDRSVFARVLSDGRIHEMEFGHDDPYLNIYITLSTGLVVEGWLMENGAAPRSDHETVTYAGTPDPVPPPAPGVRFDGIETSQFGGGAPVRSSVNLVVGQPRPVVIGGCSYTGLPVEVTRIELGQSLPQRDSMMHLTELGLTIYLGYGDADAPPATDLPLSISHAPPAPAGGSAPQPVTLPPGGAAPAPEK